MQRPQGAPAKGDLSWRGRGPARQEGEEAPPAQRVHANGRDDQAADPDLAVVPSRVPGHVRLGREHPVHLRRRHPGELQVQFFGPVLPVTVRGGDEPGEAGAEDACRHDGRDGHGGSGQRTAGRYGGPAMAGREGHPGADPAGHRAARAHARPQRRPARGEGGYSHAQRAARLGCRPPGHRDHERNGRQRDDGQAAAEKREVNLDPGPRLREPGRADRHQRGGSDGHRTGQAGPRHGHGGDPGQRQGGQAGPGHAQRPQGGEISRVQDELAAKQLGQDRQPDQSGQRGEGGQRHRLGPDGLLGRRGLARQAGGADPPGGAVVPGQRDGGPAERGQAVTLPQLHAGVIPGAEPSAGPAAPEGRAQQDPGRAAEAGGRHHLVVEGHDGRHPEFQRHRLGAVGARLAAGRAAAGLVSSGTCLRRARDAEQMEHAAGPYMRRGRQLPVDHDCPWVRRIERPPREDPHPVDGRAECAIRAGDGIELRPGDSLRRRKGKRVEHARPQRRHLRQPGEPAVEPVHAGAVGDDQHAGGVGPAEQPGIGGVGAPGAGRGGQHHPADQPQQQRQPQRRPPPQPQIGPQRQPHRPGGPRARCPQGRPPVTRRAGRWPA